jgi:Holliday junction resolvase RusA-like endonuclease
VISFFVPGIPAPKGSWRSFKRATRTVFVNDNPRTKPWADAVTLIARTQSQGRILNGALKVSLAFYVPRPKTVKRALPSTKPDLDKIVRATLDALNGVLITDDGRVVELSARKQYANDSRTGAHIEISEVQP